jgi:NitT/TauT family transport system permease protein
MTKVFRHAGPIALVLAVVVVVWYAGAVWLNWDVTANLGDDDATSWDILAGTMQQGRPLLPAPHQLAAELYTSVFEHAIDSNKSLIYHAGVTASAACLGFLIALALGVALAVGIVHVRTLDRSLMLWIITSQTIPVLAIAPMVVVVLGNIGFTGLLPKSLIAGYLSFFPIVTGMVKGLRSPDPMQRDLMRTYSATGAQTFSMLRWPASMAFLFPSLKVAATLSLVGAIVAELPTGAQAGLGARLLSGSYYGQTLQIWAALFMAAFLAMLAVAAVDLAQLALVRRRGGRL